MPYLNRRNGHFVALFVILMLIITACEKSEIGEPEATPEGSINQIESVANLLTLRPGSRRAVIQLFDAQF